jgi:hypothetical protein
MKDSYKMNVMFDANDVGTALEAAWSEGLLCGTCMKPCREWWARNL